MTKKIRFNRMIETTRISTVMMPSVTMKLTTWYPAGPVIRVFTRWVGMRKELEVVKVTVRAETVR